MIVFAVYNNKLLVFIIIDPIQDVRCIFRQKQNLFQEFSVLKSKKEKCKYIYIDQMRKNQYHTNNRDVKTIK